MPGIPRGGWLWGSPPRAALSERRQGWGRVAPCRVGDPASGAAVRADSHQSHQPQGLIVPGCAAPASQPCPAAAPSTGAPAPGLWPPLLWAVRATLGGGEGDRTPARDGAQDPQTEMGQGTLSHKRGTGPRARDLSFPSVLPTGAQPGKAQPLSTP